MPQSEIKRENNSSNKSPPVSNSIHCTQDPTASTPSCIHRHNHFNFTLNALDKQSVDVILKHDKDQCQGQKNLGFLRDLSRSLFSEYGRALLRASVSLHRACDVSVEQTDGFASRWIPDKYLRGGRKRNSHALYSLDISLNDKNQVSKPYGTMTISPRCNTMFCSRFSPFNTSL